MQYYYLQTYLFTSYLVLFIVASKPNPILFLCHFKPTNFFNRFCFDISKHLDYINEVLHENPEDDTKQHQSDDWEGGLTFIAKSSRK